MIARLDLTAINDLHEALPRLAHVPLAHLHHLNSDHRRAYWLDEIRHSLANESSIAFAWIASGTINVIIVDNDSPWDTQIIRRRIGRAEHLAHADGAPAAHRSLDGLIA